MQKIQIQAEARDIAGRQVKQLRKQGILPAVLYGRGVKSVSLQIPLKDFTKAYAEAGGSTLVYITVGDKKYPAIIHDVALDPATNKYLHADFYQVRLDEKIKADIPVVFIGEAPAVKELGGILVKNVQQLEVEGFPQDLPHELTVDISGLAEIGRQILVKDIKVADSLKIHASPDEIVVLIQAPISEEELKKQLETAPAGTAEDVEVIKKEAKPGEEGTEDLPAGKAGAPAEAGAKPAGGAAPAGKKEEKK